MQLDTTYKLIDTGLPLITLSTETIAHNYRPITFLIGWSESTEQISRCLSQFGEFMKNQFNFIFQPKYVLSDNSDAIIARCSTVFKHEYCHLLCHFHLEKSMREKTQKKELKDFKALISHGIKSLKNSSSIQFFKHIWGIIKSLWEQKKVPSQFITAFENEYIKKRFNGIMVRPSQEKVGRITLWNLEIIF